LSCAGSNSNIDPFKESSIQNSNEENKENLDNKKLYVYLKQQENQITDLTDKLKTVSSAAENQEKQFIKLKNTVDKLQVSLENQKTEPSNESQIDVINLMVKVKNKVKILEDRAFYTDSLYFEIVNDLVKIENKIISLTSSYKEMIQLKTDGSIKELPSISDEEYTSRYIESLSYYQNGEWNKSLDGFTYLIAVNSSHDLADNCQYWVGEVYYGLKDYKRSIAEFEKVFSFPGTNKSDDAQYKLGLCYLNVKNNTKALEEFNKVVDYYSNSEYYKKAKQYIKQLQN
jgi:TolA-binding protein